MTVGLKNKFVARRKEQDVIEKVGDILVDFVCYSRFDAILSRAGVSNIRPQSGPPGISIRPARTPRNVKNDRLCLSGVFFQALKYAKTRFLPPDAPPDSLVGWGGGQPLPVPFPLGVFGVSLWPPTSLKFVDLALWSKRLDTPGLEHLFV